jgi:hypothetical protein
LVKEQVKRWSLTRGPAAEWRSAPAGPRVACRSEAGQGSSRATRLCGCCCCCLVCCCCCCLVRTGAARRACAAAALSVECTTASSGQCRCWCWRCCRDSRARPDTSGRPERAERPPPRTACSWRRPQARRAEGRRCSRRAKERAAEDRDAVDHYLTTGQTERAAPDRGPAVLQPHYLAVADRFDAPTALMQ